MRKQKTTEPKQATPAGIPLAALVAFCVVLIPSYSSIVPLGFIAFAYAVLSVMDRSWEVVISVPFVILVIADILRNAFWRSLLFSIGSISLIVEWLIAVREIKEHGWIMVLTSVPFLIVVTYWNARSLNSILRFKKGVTPVP